MNRIESDKNTLINQRSGFTLVEMLVSVALVLLMMSMFAAIFQLAAGSTSTQQGIAKNDQAARSITTTIRTDLDKRTFRNVMPFQSGENENNTPIRFDDRAGYLQIVTNDPANGLDDSLLLTISADMLQKIKDKTPTWGTSRQLMDPSINPTDTPTPPRFSGHNNLIDNPNQPEMDDGDVTYSSAAIPRFSNQTTMSKAAQVAYFVRNGNLIRRVMLIRQPRARAGGELEAQPSFEDGSNPFDLDGSGSTPQYFLDFDGNGYAYDEADTTFVEAADAFWRDFDLSAVRVGGSARVLGVDALNNGPGVAVYSFGQPHFRFGHSLVGHAVLSPNGAWTGGFPRLFNKIAPADSPVFTGFFVHEETSFDGDDDFSASPIELSGGFNFPQGNARYLGSPDPVEPDSSIAVIPPGTATGDPTDIRVNLELNEKRIYEDFASGPRRAEDLLLTNVHEFRLEIWDNRLGQWVYPGHTRSSGGVAGDYHVSRRFNHGFGPFGPTGGSRLGGGVYGAITASASDNWNHTNHVFDTWHPNAFAGDAATPANPNMPPFRAMDFYPPFRPDGSIETQTTNGLVGGGVGLQSFWQPSFIDWDDFSNNNLKIYTTEDTNGNGVLDSGEDANGNGVLDVPVVFARTEDLNGDGDAADTISLGGGSSVVEDGWYGLATDTVAPIEHHLNNDVYESADPASTASSPFGYGYYFRLVQSGVAGNAAPNWQARPGARISDDHFVDGSGADVPPPPGVTSAVWQAVPNLRPLKAVRITVRFVDSSSGQMRQNTIIHSLVD